MAHSSAWRTLVLLLLAIAGTNVIAGESPPVAETRQGAVRGYRDVATDGREFFAFKGIPYAEPPVGKLRFKDPRPGVPWDGILDATEPGASCTQFPFEHTFAGVWTHMMGSEDCLLLNVFTPKMDYSAKRLPVMVFFHGGAYFFGDAKQYPAHSMMVEDILLVVVQYRLGTFGFLSTEDEAAPGNLGLKDQTLALQWVQQNIGSFGGDAYLVTIFGESAGGASVQFHMLSDWSQGLFQRAILQSGTAICPWSMTFNSRKTAHVIGEHLGCATGGADISNGELIECLQGKSTEELANVYSLFFVYGPFPLVMAPIVDGDYLKDFPAVLMKQGKMKKVDTMVGVTRHDGAFIATMVFSSETMFKQLSENFDFYGPVSVGIGPPTPDYAELVGKIFSRYIGQSTKFSDNVNGFTDMLGDRFFKISNDNTAMEQLRNLNDTDKRVFLYDFNYRGQQSFLDLWPMQYISDREIVKDWVSHVDDIAYLFPGTVVFSAHEDEADKQMTRRVVKLWANFARTGNPTPDDSQGFVWEAAEEKQLRHLVIQQQSYMRDDQRSMDREFWNSLPLPENTLAYPEKFEEYLKQMENKKTEL